MNRDFSDEHTNQQEETQQNEAEQQVDQCRQELEQWKERFMRMSADFENYKRRTEKEQVSWMRSSKMAVLRNLLPVIDTVELALLDCSTRKVTPENDSLIQGIKMMASAFHKFLESSDVTEIKEVTTFDPLLHEAIAQVATDTHESDTIVNVLQKGYRFGDQVMRPAKVTVAK